MKKELRALLASSFAVMAFVVTSCGNNENNEPAALAGEGNVTLDITSKANSFTTTRAVDEATYANIAGYTVKILTAEGVEKTSSLYSEIPTTIKLDNGSYILQATYGEAYKDAIASRDGFYVTGERNFQVQGKDVTVSVDCYPTCGKLKASFSDNMSEYFSNYYIEFQTEKSKANNNGKIMWAAEDKDPWYVTLTSDSKGEDVTAVVTYTRLSDSKKLTQAFSYNMTSGKQWNLNIVPKDNGGYMVIDIVIDETTNDRPVDIEVPGDWLD